MRIFQRRSTAVVFFLVAVFMFGPKDAHSSPIIEMPDTTEVPELETSSALVDMDIPSVRERSPDPMAGPRLNVKEFRVQGLVEYPELGISRAEIIERVEALRFDLMEEGKLLDSGYTLNELGELSDLLGKIEDETTIEHVGPIEVQRLVFLVREQRRERGITLGMIEMVADTITRYYRERGFVLAKAFIPQQHVRDGVVTLTLLLGELGEVVVHNNVDYSESRIQGIFKGAMGKPITAQKMEEYLYFVNDLPGLSAQGFFEAGSQVGDSRLNVNVLDERWYDASLRLDNHGSESSGEYRLYADFLFNNPLGIGDQVHLALLNSFQPDNSLYGSFRYNTHLFSPRLRLSLGVSNNDFAVAGNESQPFSDLGITGHSRVADFSTTYILKRSRARNHKFGFEISQIESVIESELVPAIGLTDEVQNMELFYEFDTLNQKSRTLHQARMAFTSSKFVAGADAGQDDNPWILNLNYSLLTFLDVPLLSQDSRAILQSSFQYSGTSLSSINRFSLAGPTKARGFIINEFYADDGLSLSADWVFQGPAFGGVQVGGKSLSEVMQPFVFVDAGYGMNHSLVDGKDDTTAYLSDIGVGLKLSYGSGLRANITLAKPLSAEIASGTDVREPDRKSVV